MLETGKMRIPSEKSTSSKSRIILIRNQKFYITLIIRGKTIAADSELNITKNPFRKSFHDHVQSAR